MKPTMMAAALFLVTQVHAAERPGQAAPAAEQTGEAQQDRNANRPGPAAQDQRPMMGPWDRDHWDDDHWNDDDRRSSDTERWNGTMMGVPCGDMKGAARVTIENTKDGAVVRFVAKDAASVNRVQQMAQTMQTCTTVAPGQQQGP